MILDPLEHVSIEKEISNFKNGRAKDILNNIFSNVNVPKYVFNRLLRPVTFGHYEAKTIHSLCGGKKDFSKKIGEIGGIYVAWVCYFDELYDKSPDVINYIKNHIDKKLLIKAINDASLNRDIFLKDISNSFDIRATLFFLLWQSYIQESYKLYKSSTRIDIWKEFTTTISKQYFQEIECLEFKIPKFQPNLWQKIGFRSCSPLWVNFLINFLSKDTNLEFYSPKLREAVLKLGMVAKIVDDIIDLPDDLSNRRWNYLFIKAYNKYPSILDKIDKLDDLEIIQLIINNGIIDESIYDACNSYHSAIITLRNIGLLTKDLEQYLRLFLSNWFK